MSEIKYRPAPTTEEILEGKQTRFDVLPPVGPALKYLVSRKDDQHFFAALQPRFTYLGRLDPESGLVTLAEMLAIPPDDMRVRVGLKAIEILYGREELPEGFGIRGAKIEPPKKKRSKKARKSDEAESDQD